MLGGAGAMPLAASTVREPVQYSFLELSAEASFDPERLADGQARACREPVVLRRWRWLKLLAGVLGATGVTAGIWCHWSPSSKAAVGGMTTLDDTWIWEATPGSSAGSSDSQTAPGSAASSSDDRGNGGEFVVNDADYGRDPSTGDILVESAPIPSTVPPCAAFGGDDCRVSRCCSNPAQFCFMKSDFWAACLDDCTPGVHLDDPPEYQDPWSCRMVAPDGQPEYPTLFCFMAVQSSGMELDLVKHQAALGKGIFACDGFALFSDSDATIADGVRTYSLQRFAAPLSVPGALTATWVNTDGFVEAWGSIMKMAQPWKSDYIVKVDPDTVFFPILLKVHLRSMQQTATDLDAGSGVFLKNCMAVGQLQLYGSMEVISKKALGRLSGKEHLCDTPDSVRMGEDLYMQRCLETLGVVGVDGTAALRDRYCPVEGERSCGPGVAAFHPYKAVQQWDDCRTAVQPDPSAGLPLSPRIVYVDWDATTSTVQATTATTMSTATTTTSTVQATTATTMSTAATKPAATTTQSSSELHDSYIEKGLYTTHTETTTLNFYAAYIGAVYKTPWGGPAAPTPTVDSANLYEQIR